jgi:hypothetical protein
MTSRKLKKRKASTNHPASTVRKQLLSLENRRVIVREAKALGLSTNEYMRLIIGLASSLREGIGDDKKVEGRQLLQLVENPLFTVILKTVVQSVALPTEEESDEESPAKDAVATPNQSGPQNPRQMYPNPYGPIPYPQSPYPQYLQRQQLPLQRPPQSPPTMSLPQQPLVQSRLW